MYSTFISAKELMAILNEPSTIIIDCRFNLGDTQKGYRDYLDEHIEGAIYAHLDEDLSGRITEYSGRHPLPYIDKFKKWIFKNGISMRDQIVTYDDIGGAFAARLWFMLEQLGYTAAVLNGGWQFWKGKEYPTKSGPESRNPLESPEKLILKWEDGPYKIYYSKELNEMLENEEVQLIDSRSEDRYLGVSEPLDPIAGAIPGALNHFWGSNLTENKMLIDAENLKEKFLKFHKENTVYSCGSGVSACVNILVAKHLGLPKPALFVDSWSGWIKNYPDKIQKVTKS